MPAIFEIMFGGRMSGAAGGRGGQTRHTKIYCMFVDFYCFSKSNQKYILTPFDDRSTPCNQLGGTGETVKMRTK